MLQQTDSVSLKALSLQSPQKLPRIILELSRTSQNYPEFAVFFLNDSKNTSCIEAKKKAC